MNVVVKGAQRVERNDDEDVCSELDTCCSSRDECPLRAGFGDADRLKRREMNSPFVYSCVLALFHFWLSIFSLHPHAHPPADTQTFVQRTQGAFILLVVKSCYTQ